MKNTEDYIQLYNEIVEKFLQSNDEIILEAYNSIARKMIESMYKEYTLKNKLTTQKITKFFSAQSRELKFSWMNINYNNHVEKENHVIGSINNHNHSLLKIASFFGYNIKKIYDIDMESEIEWRTIANGKKEYSGLVEKRNDLFYTISFKDKGYSQKNKHIFKSDIPMSEGIHYKISTKIEAVILKGEDTGIRFEKVTAAEPMVFNNNLIDERVSSVINKILQKHEMSPMDFIFAFPNSHLVQELKDIFNSDKTNSIFWNVIALKYFDDFVLKSNQFDSPINFEFWTKNPRIKGLSLSEKILLKKYILTSKKFFGLENAKLDRRLYTESVYYINGEFDHEDFPENQWFNNSHKEKMVVQGGGYYTLKEIENMINSFRSNFINENIDFKINNKILQENKAWKLNGEQKQAIIYSLKNTRTIIMGPAGTGKTKTAAKIIESVIDAGENYIFLAPTHKAKSVVEEMEIETNNDIQSETIQQIISSPVLIKGIENIIIDEISMVNDTDWIKILNIVSDAKRLIFIGDDRQLPPLFSIGVTKLFSIGFLSDNIQKLTMNMRQEDKEDRKEVNNLRDKSTFINPERYFKTFSDFSDCINQIKKYNKQNYKIITPIHFGLLGTRSLNSMLGNDFENIKKGDRFLISETINSAKFLYKNLELTVESFKENIIEFSNPWKQKDIFGTRENREGFFFRGGKLFYQISEVDEIPFVGSKTITVHSSQGSTYNNVLLLLPPGYEISKEMMYTASTRFRSNLRILAYKNFDISKYTNDEK